MLTEELGEEIGAEKADLRELESQGSGCRRGRRRGRGRGVEGALATLGREWNGADALEHLARPSRPVPTTTRGGRL